MEAEALCSARDRGSARGCPCCSNKKANPVCSEAATKPQRFQIAFGGVTRALSRQQLERAPQSLISTALLAEGNATEKLRIPCAADQHSTPEFAVWQAGTADLFQVLLPRLHTILLVRSSEYKAQYALARYPGQFSGFGFI